MVFVKAQLAMDLRSLDSVLGLAFRDSHGMKGGLLITAPLQEDMSGAECVRRLRCLADQIEIAENRDLEAGDEYLAEQMAIQLGGRRG